MRTFVFIFAIAACGRYVCASDVVFEQLPALPNNPGLSSPVNLDLSLGGHRTADDFTLTEGHTITEVNWWGGCHLQAPPSSCLADGEDDFTFSFYDSVGNLPRNLLLETTGTMLVNTTGATYAASLDTPFEAIADTQYWLSIFNRALYQPWGWHNSASGNNTSASARNPALDEWNDVPGSRVDTAFRLAIPEPSSLMLAAMAVVGLLARFPK
jgi:PEP-CTERM motif-containing protein